MPPPPGPACGTCSAAASPSAGSAASSATNVPCNCSPTSVTRRVAEEIRRLHDQIGDLVAPPVREVPPLSRLRRAERKVA